MGSTEERVQQASGVSARLFQRIAQQARPLRKWEPPRASNESGPAPLASGQQRLWLMTKLSPDSASFHIPAVLRLHGSLNVTALNAALSELTRRHSALRTLIREIDETPMQYVQAPQPFELRVVDWQGTPEELREAIRQEAARPYDLATELPLRARLYRLDESDHRLLLVIHHIVADGWSVEIALREIGVLYESQLRGAAAALPAAALSFADFARWERREDTWTRLEEQLDYWRGKLDASSPTELPTDYARPPVFTANASMYVQRIEPDITSRLEQVCREQGVTPFMALLAAFNVLLSRYTGSHDVCVGTTVANRGWKEIEPVIGLFANLLTLRSDLSGRPTFPDLLQRVRATTLEAYEHQAVSFHRVVDALKPHRDRSRSPLFQINLVFHNTRDSTASVGPRDVATSGSLAVTSEAWSEPQALYDLSLYVVPENGALRATFTYNADLYCSRTIERLAAQFVVLLSDALARPRARIDELNVCTPADARELHALAGDPGLAERYDQPVHAMFEEQARATPNVVAVVDGPHGLTYQELNQRANRLADLLVQCGVGPETLVGLCLRREVNAVVAMLALLKIGAAYVPLDPDAPPERLQAIMSSAGLAVVVTKRALADSLPAYELNFVTVLALDELEDTLSACSNADPRLPVTTRHAAYVIYTSGSTGIPKGVVVEHDAILRLVCDSNYIDCGPHLNVAQASTMAFDASVFEIWGALLHGGCLTFVDKDDLLDPDRFADCVDRNGINTLFITTALLNRYARHRPTAFARLRTVFFGGEQVDARAVRRLIDANRTTTFVHVYGPTENTVFSTYYPVAEVDAHAATVPIGRMLSGTVGYVLDDALKLVPPGAIGQLYVGGRGLARCYQNAPGETAMKFLPDPYSSQPGARLYCTGDLARWNDAGQIEFVGRKDGQVKLRGFRIEIGEIETALAACPGVATAVVTVRSAANQERMLVAYWTRADGADTQATDLRESLSARLPAYMIPQWFVQLESLPLNINGKVDRAALPEPTVESNPLHTELRQPSTDQERAVAEAFASVLGLPSVGVVDNFFALGGDSLRAISVKAELEERGYSIAVHELFESPTVARLARLLKQSTQAPRAWIPFSMIDPQDRDRLPPDVEDAYPLSALQLGMLFHDDYQGGVYHEVIYYTVSLPFSEPALRASLEVLARRHEMLRTSFALAGHAQPLQFVHGTAEIPLHVVDLRERSAFDQQRTLDRWLDEQKRRRHDPAVAPLLGIHVHWLAEQRFQLGLCFSHAILDGWSDAAAVVELLQLYQAQLDCTSIELPRLALRYRDYIEAEQRAIADAGTAEFWQRLLRGCQVTSVTPGGVTANATSIEGGHVRVNVSADTLHALKRLSKDLGVPLKSILLAAHLKVLGLFGGTQDVVCGLVTNGRPESRDGERAVGMFLNTVPFRLQLRPSSWETLIGEAFAAETAMLPYRRYPLPRMMQDMQTARLFQVVFNYTDFHVAQQLEPRLLGRISGPGGKIATSIPVAVNFTSHNDGGLHGAISYHSAVCPPDRAAHIAACMERVLESIAQRPKQSHTASAYLPPECDPRQQSWYPVRKESSSALITQLIREQCARVPDAIAVRDGDATMTYAQMYSRAATIASLLIEQGVQAGDCVAVYGARNVDWVVNVIAIWLAGAAYLPLDPVYPSARLQQMISAAHAKIGIARQEDQDRLTALGLRLLDLARPALGVAASATPPLQQLAYVLFTSGTTGAPKGVEITHEGLGNLAIAQRQLFDIAASDRVLQFSNLGFDASIWELVMALANGAELVIVPDEARRSREALTSILTSHAVTVATLPPSVLATLGDCATPQLRVLVAAGEACSSALVSRWAGVTRFFNAYGPTEYTVCTTAHETGQSDPPPIGLPIRNTQVHVLDAALNPVPIGTVGDLYVSGTGIARGYARRPDLTAARFVPDPFAASGGERMYWTGDLARYTKAGRIEYVGRNDQQVKLRGHRVELVEIEDLIGKYPGVTGALCLAVGEAERCTLVAYYTTSTGVLVTARELRGYLRAHVAEFAVPGNLVQLTAFPLTENGKIDREAIGKLPTTPTSNARVEPGDALQLRLVEVWQRVLRREPLGIRDDFFQLGGNSLLAMELIACVRRELTCEVTVADLYKAPTIEELARIIAAGRPNSMVTVLRESGRGPRLFLLHAVGGAIWCYGQLAARLAEKYDVYAVQRPEFASGVGVQTLSIIQLAELYSRQIEQHQQCGPYAIAGWSFGGILAAEVASCLRRRGHEVSYVCMIDSRLPTQQERTDVLKKLRDLAGEGAVENSSDIDRILADATVRTVVDAEIGLAGAPASELVSEQAEQARRVAVANLIALYRHVPTTRIERAHYIAAIAKTAEDEMSRRLAALRSQLVSELIVTEIPASHTSVLQMPVAAEVATAMISQGQQLPASVPA